MQITSGEKGAAREYMADGSIEIKSGGNGSLDFKN